LRRHGAALRRRRTCGPHLMRRLSPPPTTRFGLDLGSSGMCGRFVSASPPDQIAAYFSASMSETVLAPSYNVAPTNDVYAVVETPDGERRLETFHWGLVPVWAKDMKTGLK